jgi:hypothetical protein
LIASAAGCSLVTSWAGYVGDGDAGGGADGQAETGGPSEAGMHGDSSPAGDASEENTDGEGSDVAASEDAAADAQDASAPTFVQVTYATPSTASTASATFSQAQGAGDLVVLVIGWGGTASLAHVGDSAGNSYAPTIAPTHISAGITQAIYYAKGIGPSQPGANTVTVTLYATATPLDLRAVEYAGLDPVSPYDVSFAFGGRAMTANSGDAGPTTTARELVFGAGITVGSFTGAGTGFTLRKLTGGGIGVVEDRVVWSTGSYSADAPLTTFSSYVMQVATFR